MAKRVRRRGGAPVGRRWRTPSGEQRYPAPGGTGLAGEITVCWLFTVAVNPRHLAVPLDLHAFALRSQA